MDFNNLVTAPTPAQTLAVTLETLRGHFPEADPGLLTRIFEGVEKLFGGKYPGYQGCDTAFHDLKHTCEATVAMVHLLDGHTRSRTLPMLQARDYELGIAAMLLHDSGYFKEASDTEGTGAKYTLVHVERSADFAAKFLAPLGLGASGIGLVQRAIQCTGLGVDTREIDFSGDRERFIGCAVGTADILGQMAAPDYPERLPELYKEFVEAAEFAHVREGGVASYTSAADLMQKTRGFWEGYVKPMLEKQWEGAYRGLTHHFPGKRNPYFDAIEENLRRIDLLAANAS